VPTSADDVTINVAGNPTIVISGTESVRSIQLSNRLDLEAGTLSVNAASQISGTGSLQLVGGTFEIEANTLSNLGQISISGSSAVEGGMLDNKGTIVQSGGTLTLAALLENEATYDFTGDGSLSIETAGAFTNTSTGMLEKTGGTGSSTSSGAGVLNNQGGTVQASTGALRLGSGTSTGGTYNALTGALIDLTDGQFPVFSGSYTGSGNIQIDGGAVAIGAGGATFDFSGNQFQMLGSGAINLQGNTLTNLGILNAAGQFQSFISQRGGNVNLGGTFDNKGSLVLAASATLNLFDGLSLENEGSIVMSGDSNSIAYGGNNASTVLNTGGGLFEKTVGVGTSSVGAGLVFNNQGTALVSSGTLSFSASVTQVTGSTLAGGGWAAAGTGTLVLPGGNFDTNDGTVTLSDSGSFPQINPLDENDGSFSLLGGHSFTTLSAFVNGGTLAIGPGSVVTIAAGQTLLSNSIVTINIAGTPASGLFGRLDVTDFNAFNGTLNIVLATGFLPAAGQAYTIMSYEGSSNGDSFSAINGLTSSGSPIFTAATNPTTFVLTALQLPVPRVTGVLVDGTAWTPGYLSALAAAGLGNGAGYAIPVGSAAQLQPLGWTNLSQIQIVFNQNVNVQSTSLALTGSNVSNYAFSSFNYSAATFTATWTLGAVIGDDKLSIDLQAAGSSAAVTNGQGTALDGEWTNGVSKYPSGDGAPGGDFNFAFNVLPGSINGGTIVNAQDIALVASHWLVVGAIVGDTNGDNIVNAQDIAAIASRWLTTLPTGGSGQSLVGGAEWASLLLGIPPDSATSDSIANLVTLPLPTLWPPGPQSLDRSASFGPQQPNRAATTVEVLSAPSARVLGASAPSASSRLGKLSVASSAAARQLTTVVEYPAASIDDDLLDVLAAARRS
jgi:hypothetical protein